MPFIDERRVAQAPTNYAPFDQADADPSLGDTFGAAFRTQNVIGSYLTSRGQPDPYQIEDGFDAIDYIKDDTKLAPYAEQFAGIFNRKAAEAKKSQIFQEERDRRTLDAAGGMGLVAELAAGVFDAPTFLAPGGFLVGGSKSVAGTVGRMAVAGGLDAATSELALQSTQATRTAEETALNVGGSVILSGALGALVGRYLAPSEIKPLSDKIERQNDEFATFDQEVFGGSTGNSSAGAAARDAGPLKLKDEAIIAKLPLVNQQDPLIRSQLSDFDSVRQTVRGLAETPLEYEANAQGVATETRGSVETRMKLWHAPEAQTLSQIDQIYAGYYHGTPEPSSVQMALAPIRSEMQRLTGGNKLTFKQFKEEVGRAAYSGEQHPIPQVAEAAKAYRAVDEKLKQAAIEARLLPEDIAVQKDVSHIFRMYNREKIIAHRNRFAAILQDHFTAQRDIAARIAQDADKAEGAAKASDAASRKAEEFANLSDAEVREVVDETINSILGNADGRIPYDSIVSGPRGALKERTLNIESEKIRDFLNLDIEEVLRSQIRTMSADIEIARKFGSVDMAEQIRQINDEADRKIAVAQSDKERTRLESARRASVRDIEAMRDRIRGQYALPANPDGLVLRANRVVRNLNYLRLLGGMTVSAIPDMGRIVFTHGLTSTFRDGFVPLVTNFRKFRLAAEEVKQAGTALDMVLDSRTMAIADITGEFGRHSKFERGIQSLSSKFGVVSLMAPWNASMKQFSGMVVMTNILRSAKNVAAGTATTGEIRRLAQSNIDRDMAARIASMFDKHGDSDGDVWLAKAANWEDVAAQETFRGAVVRDVDRIVVSPGQDKPLWMSTELGKTVGQFKSFSISAMQRITLAGLQQRDAAALNGMMVTIGLGAVSYYLSQKIAGRDVSDKPSVWAVNAFDKSGLAGWMMEANNIVEKATRGKVGASFFTGEPVSRYASRNVTSAFLGPTPGTVADIFSASGSIFAGDFARSDLNKLRQMVPAQNLFYLRWLFNQMEKGAGEALDLPEKAK